MHIFDRKIPQIFFFLGVSSLLSVFFLGLRWILVPEWVAPLFMVWNLILAWIPFLLSSLFFQNTLPKKQLPLEEIHSKDGAKKLPSQSNATHFPSILQYVIFGIVFLLWFLFYPNAAYIVTDCIHIGMSKYPLKWVLNIVLMTAFSWTGYLLGLFSLNHIHSFIKVRAGVVLGWIFVIIMSFLSSIAIFIGRVLRWNSWDIFVAPQRLMHDIAELFLYPVFYADIWILCLSLTWIFVFSYFIFEKILSTFHENDSLRAV